MRGCFGYPPFWGAVLSVLLSCTPVFADWTNGQAAEYVIGQANFTTSVSGTTATTLNQPAGVAVDETNNKLYVADSANNRVLRYDWPLTANQPAADLVFGQSNLNSGAANRGGVVAANTLSNPRGVAIDATGRLWVADRSNNRVVWYNAAHSAATDGPDADGALGQNDFVNNTANQGGGAIAAANTLNNPNGVFVDASNTLWLADRNNSRILRFANANSLTTGAAADGVLGQADFVASGASGGAARMSSPQGCAMSGSSLFVADQGNNRVLRFDNAATAADGDGASADGVLGQANITSNSPNRGLTAAANTLNNPTHVMVDPGGRLYVCDLNNFRALIYLNATGKADGDPADIVIGQPDFTTASQAASSSKFSNPLNGGLANTDGKLLISDFPVNRVLQFDRGATLPVTLSAFSLE